MALLAAMGIPLPIKYLVEKTIRIILAVINLLLALNAFGGGAYGILGAKEMPRQWLTGSPFNSYFIPGLFLFFVVGGSCTVTAVLLFKNARGARTMCFVTGVLLLIWITAQVSMIGYVSWLQPAVAVSAVLIIELAFILRSFARK